MGKKRLRVTNVVTTNKIGDEGFGTAIPISTEVVSVLCALMFQLGGG